MFEPVHVLNYAPHKQRSSKVVFYRVQQNDKHIDVFMTIIYYESSDDEFEGFKDYEESKNFDATKPDEIFSKTKTYSSNKFSLPPPKKKSYAPPPPEPVKIIHPIVAQAKKEDFQEEEIIEIDAETLKEKDAKLAQDNAIVKDKTMYHGVGRQREKSQLTYLSEVFAQDAGNYQRVSRRTTQARTKAAQMYGW